jgi:diphosphomevalonate decarboxylase
MRSQLRKISYEAPSNIALVKYWGKYGNQLPTNASVSFTLSQCKSIFEIELLDKKQERATIDLEFEGIKNDSFVPKIQKLFDKIENEYPVVKDYDWKIKSSNTFPHSSGIASSASSMACLAMCIDELQHGEIDIQRASMLARMGSGSASRSVIPKLGWWGAHPTQALTSQEYAIPVWQEVDEVFHTYQNTILIVHAGEKSVSSTAGHDLMNTNEYAKVRYQNAYNNIVDLIGAMREGDLDRFGEIVEFEAMSLHALMMMSHPSFILLKPNTLNIIERIKSYRNETKLPVYFTLDAGPNIHLLYPQSIKNEVENWIDSELKQFCENGLYIKDDVGDGPKKIG